MLLWFFCSAFMRTFIIGTRGSPLALAQTRFVENYLASQNIPYVIHTIKTTGDIIQDRPLYEIGGKALFSKEIERCLEEKTIDIAVHSLKDLETPRPKGFEIVAYLSRADARDVLVTHFNYDENKVYGCQINDLAQKSFVGTSAPRRMALLNYHRPDLQIIPLRGNVGTRLGKLNGNKENYDAMIFAKAGLDRLGIAIEGTAILSKDTMIPAAGQGIVALECRSDDEETKILLREMNDPTAQLMAQIERGYIERLENASCRSAVGIHVEVNYQNLHVRTMVANPEPKIFNHHFERETSFEAIWQTLIACTGSRLNTFHKDNP